ncbi:hypothetical protein ACFX1Z_024748 [Malus domestica]
MLPLSTKEGGKRKTTVVGPWGGNGGIPWDDGIYNGVREITVVYGHCIDSITLIKLEYPDEYLVSVTGNYCLLAYGGTAIIRSLKFQSNRRKFGPFGIEEGTTFTYNVEGGKIVGLKGRNGWYIDAVGFHVSPAPTKLFRRVQKSFRRLGSSGTRETETTAPKTKGF